MISFFDSLLLNMFMHKIILKIVALFTYLLAGFAVFLFILMIGGNIVLSSVIANVVMIGLIIIQILKNRKHGTK
jgi:hypothetical protein